MFAIQIFVYLQILDLLTTLLGFRVGAAEASPFVAKMIMISSPLAGVVFSKLLALGLGAFCLITHRQKIVNLANYGYAGLIVWNLVVIFAAINRSVGA